MEMLIFIVPLDISGLQVNIGPEWWGKPSMESLDFLFFL